MWLFVIVVASGLLGAHLQHMMPRRLLRDVPMETIYEQIEHVRTQLLEEADTVVAEARQTGVRDPDAGSVRAAARSQPVAAAGPAKAALATTERIEAEESAPCERSTCGICGRSSRDRQRAIRSPIVRTRP